MSLAASLGVGCCQARRGLFQFKVKKTAYKQNKLTKTSYEGAIEPQIISKMGEIREPI